MKKHSTTLLLFVVLFVGLALLLYPSISDLWNSLHQSRAVATYTQALKAGEDTDYSPYWEEARAYNERLKGIHITDRLNMRGLSYEEYNRMLRVGDSSVLGVIEIPEIALTLPLYHGTSEQVLQVAVGHLTGTSMPTGGPGTHSAFSAHRGLPSAKLFTNLDQLTYGDIFTLRVLDEYLTYEIDQILIVLPHQVDALAIEEGKDYCSLITCTPYGVNSHRLIIRGHRIENSLAAQAARVASEAVLIDPMIVAPVVAAPMLLVLLVIMLISTDPKRKKKKAQRRNIDVVELVRSLDENHESRNGGERP